MEVSWLCQLVLYSVFSVGVIITVQVIFNVYSLIKERNGVEKQINGIVRVPGHWFWGNIKQLGGPEKLLEVLRERMKKYGPVMHVRDGPLKPVVQVCGEEYVKAVLATTQPKDKFISGFMYDWIGDGLLLSHGQKWTRDRKLLTPAFHFEILKSYMEAYNSAAQVLIKKWEEKLNEKSSIEMLDSFSLLTLDILLRCTFGYESNCQLYGKRILYIEATIELSRLVVERTLNPLLFPDTLFNMSTVGKQFKEYTKIIHDYSQNVTKSRRKDLDNNKKLSDEAEENKKSTKCRIDFLDILLMARDEDGQGLTDLEIQHEVDTFMFAGHDTTSSALSWLMYNLARHPEIQKRCRDEVNSVVQSNEVPWENLSQLEYLTCCIKESLRLHNPIPIMTRTLCHPVDLPNNVTLPKGLSVYILVDALHHSPDLWKDPNIYDPDRFLPENFAKMPSHAFLGFSAGPRNCIGQNFAMNEMKVCASLLLKHFEFSVDESISVEPCFQIVLRSKDGIWLKVKKI